MLLKLSRGAAELRDRREADAQQADHDHPYVEQDEQEEEFPLTPDDADDDNQNSAVPFDPYAPVKAGSESTPEETRPFSLAAVAGASIQVCTSNSS